MKRAVAELTLDKQIPCATYVSSSDGQHFLTDGRGAVNARYWQPGG